MICLFSSSPSSLRHWHLVTCTSVCFCFLLTYLTSFVEKLLPIVFQSWPWLHSFFCLRHSLPLPLLIRFITSHLLQFYFTRTCFTTFSATNALSTWRYRILGKLHGSIFFGIMVLLPNTIMKRPCSILNTPDNHTNLYRRWNLKRNKVRSFLVQ